MNISISPVATGLAILVASNCIISFGKSNIMKKCYIILSSILSIIGISGIIKTRSQFLSSLNRNSNIRHFDSEFVSWAIAKYDLYAVITIAATCLTITLLMFLLLVNKKNKNSFVWVNLSIFVIILMVVNFFAGVCYSFETINKLFDVAYYILILSIYEIFALYIPLLVKRIIMLKE